MTFRNWIDKIIDAGQLCAGYQTKVLDAISKKEVMDIVLDANGVSYLLEMQERGLGLPYETIISEFRPYINGRYVGEFKNEKGNGYTSKIYCCYSDNKDIVADTTALVLLGCNNTIDIPENAFVKIYADKNCDIEINCPKSARAIVEHSSGALVSISCGHENVELIDRGYGPKQHT